MKNNLWIPVNSREFQSLSVTNRVLALIAALQEVERTLLVIQNQPVKLQHLNFFNASIGNLCDSEEANSLPPSPNTNFQLQPQTK